MRNHDVAQAWGRGISARSSTGNFHTDGQRIYSYELCIGETMPDGRKRLFDKTASGEWWSMTTSHHVSHCFGVADVFVRGVTE